MSKSYTRRTPEQQIQDLQDEIDRVRLRAEAKQAAAEVKGSPDGVVFLASVKAVDKAIRVAGEHNNDAMVRVLEAARAPLAEHLVSMGVRLPDQKARRSRRRKSQPTASAHA